MSHELIQFHQPFTQSFKDDLQLIGAAGIEVTDLSPMAAFLLAGVIEKDPVVHSRRRCDNENFPALSTNSTYSILKSMSLEELQALRDRVQPTPKEPF